MGQACLAGRRFAGVGRRRPVDLPQLVPPPVPAIAARPAAPAVTPKRDRTMHWVWTMLACLCVAGVAVFATAYVYTQAQRDWERANRDKVLAMNAEAVKLAKDGRFVEAFEQYRRLNELVGARSIRDPFLAEQVGKAQSEQQRVYSLMVQAQVSQELGMRFAPAAVETPLVAPPPPRAAPRGRLWRSRLGPIRPGRKMRSPSSPATEAGRSVTGHHDSTGGGEG